MKKSILCFVCAIVLLVGCKKKEPAAKVDIIASTPTVLDASCGSEIVADKAIKVGGRDFELPVGTKFCVAKDHSEIRVELPAGYSFGSDGLASRATPILFATYACNCSGGGTCQVTYSDDLGFGCMHNNCSGSCTGYFTYKGYSVNRLVDIAQSKEKVLTDSAVQKEIIRLYLNATDKSAEQSVYGIKFYFKVDPGASCDCQGTKACVLKTLGITDGKLSFKIYYCDGKCNECELTV